MKRILLLLIALSGLMPALAPAADGHDHGAGSEPGLFSAYTSGHGDIGAGFHDGELDLHMHLHQGAVVNAVPLLEDAEPDPDATMVVVGNSARQMAGPDLSAGTGVAVGAPLWILPASPSAELPHFGFGTEELDPADWNGDITFEIHEVNSPSGSGHFSIFASDGLGGFEFLASTADGGLDENDRVTLPAGGHDHFFIAFSEPGLWEVGIVASGEHMTEGVLTSGHVPFLFHVGPSHWTSGHGDIGLAYEDSELELHMHLHEGASLDGATMEADTEHHPEDIIVEVGREAIQVAGAGIAEGTGVAEGAPVWILPTSANPHLPFVGFGTEELDPADWTGDLSMKLVSISSPSGGGQFSVYRPDGLGGAEFLISTAQGGISGEDHVDLPAGGHDHFFIAFSESGLWRVTLEAEGQHGVDGAVSTGPVEIVFEVAPNGGGTITLAEAAYTVSQGTTSVPVTLVREHGTAETTLVIEAENGTASAVPPYAAGLAGRDYPAAMQELEVGFAEGEMSKVVPVMLIPRAGSVPNIRFSVHLHEAGPDTEFGDQDETEIRILANDTIAPGLVLTTPAAPPKGQVHTPVSTTAPYLIKGSAGDARGLERVEVVFNAGPAVNATLGSATSPSAVPWSLQVEPLNGVNTVSVTAYDLKGNASTTITRSFQFTRRQTLAVRRVAPAGVSADTAGTVTTQASPASASGMVPPLVANGSPRNYAVVPGTPMKLTATPRAGHLFSHWASVPAGAVSVGNVLSFAMPAADAEAEAVFVVNALLPVAGAGNAFFGLVHPDEGTTAGSSTVGFINGTLVPVSGSFSGRILMNGVAQSFVATFYGDGTVLFNVTGGRAASLGFDGGARQLSLGSVAGQIQAVVTAAGGGQSSSGALKRAAHGAASPVSATLLNEKTFAASAGNNRGYLTVALPAKAQTPPMPPGAYPQGDGVGTLTISSVGAASFVGTLADGSAFTAGSGMVSGSEIPFLAQLLTPGASTRGGSFSGTLLADAAQADSDVTGAGLLWFRPAVTQSPGAAGAATQRYTAGWPQGITVDAVGALYARTRSVQESLGLPEPSLAAGNGLLEFTLGKLTGAPVGHVAVTRFNINVSVVTKIPVNNPAFTLVPVPGTGAFSGTFTPNWTSRSSVLPSYRGILLQKGASRGGYGWFISNRLNDLDPESGRVTLGAP